MLCFTDIVTLLLSLSFLH